MMWFTSWNPNLLLPTPKAQAVPFHPKRAAQRCLWNVLWLRVQERKTLSSCVTINYCALYVKCNVYIIQSVYYIISYTILSIVYFVVYTPIFGRLHLEPVCCNANHLHGTCLSTFQHSTRVAGLQFGGIHWDHCRQDLHSTKWSKAFKVAYKSGNVTPFRPFFLLSKGRISHIKEIWWLEPCTSPERTDFCPQKEAQLIPVQLQLHPKFL